MGLPGSAVVRAAAGALAILTTVGTAPGQMDPRYDPSTGRDLANWPPSPHFHYRHMRLEMDIPDMNAPRFTAVQTLTVSPIGAGRAALRLDAGPGIGVTGVRAGGRPAPFTHEGSVLTVRFPTPLRPGADTDVVVEYDCDLTNNHGKGLTWSEAKPEAKSETGRAPQLHSQGEAQENHRWFPCHDFPNVKLPTELIVIVEDGYEVCSNGRLVSRRSSRGRTTWHWLQDKPHVFYLVTLVVGKLAVVDINADPTASARPGLPMHVYTPIGTEDNVRESFAQTPAMIAYFEAKFDEPYPWAKYDQLIVRDFAWGGMENTSATTLYLPASMGGDHTDLISHELAHQWFGDLVTCKSWEHLWLNEGWASIAEALWREDAANRRAAIAGAPGSRAPDPDEDAVAEESLPDAAPASAPGGAPADTGVVAPATAAGRRAYQRKVLDFIRGQRAGNRAYAPIYPSVASRYYRSPDEPIMKTDDVYAKGALILHMLRAGLGDEVFTAGTRLYLDRFKFTSVETDDFRRCMEEASGKSLERFFEQWAMRPGLPRLDVDLEYDAGTLSVTVEQSQKIDADNPAYEFTLPLLLKFEDGTHRYEYLEVDRRRVSAAFKVPDRPAQVSVDPNLTVIAATVIRKPLAMWLDELNDPPSLGAQLQAAEHLAGNADPQAQRALALLAADGHADTLVRHAAAAACNATALRQRAGAAIGLTKMVLQPFFPAERGLAAGASR